MGINRRKEWVKYGVAHFAEYRTTEREDKIVLDARVNNGPWIFFCLNVDQVNADNVGNALIERLANENGWREDEIRNN